jgi:hypothetical protein
MQSYSIFNWILALRIYKHKEQRALKNQIDSNVYVDSAFKASIWSYF